METDSRHRDLIERQARVLIAGLEAEKRFTGRHHWRGARTDLHNAVDLVSYLAGSSEEAEAYVKLIRVQSRAVINRHWAAVERMAETLMVRQRVTGAEAVEIIES